MHLYTTLLAGCLLATPALADDSVARGAYLARIADCNACHTAPGGPPGAGGLGIDTPLGTLYSTNITPDPETGIGRYSYADFARALRQGMARDGHMLYPAMPWPAYARISETDLQDLYAWSLRGQAPVRQANRASDVPWPLSLRWPLRIWRRLFHDDQRWQPDPARSASWNRGSYIVEGMGHCGACHTPRGTALQEIATDGRDPAFLAGAGLGEWRAGRLRHDARGLGHWTREDLVNYLREGRNRHTEAIGPMREVIDNSTRHLDPTDLEAIADYLLALPGSSPP